MKYLGKRGVLLVTFEGVVIEEVQNALHVSEIIDLAINQIE